MTAFQMSSLVGVDYKGISDAHNMVLVLAKLDGQETHSGAAEPTGSTKRRAATLKAAPTSDMHRGAAELNSADAELTGTTERKTVVPKRGPTGENPRVTAESNGPTKRKGLVLTPSPGSKQFSGVAQPTDYGECARVLPKEAPTASDRKKPAAQEALSQQQKHGRAAQSASSGSNSAIQQTTTVSSDDPRREVSVRDASELTAGAEQASKDFANLLEDQPKQPVRRKANDGLLYSKPEFINFYENEGVDMWESAEPTEEFDWGVTNDASILGRALWPREMPKKVMVVEDGEIMTAAATCPTATLITETFETLLRVRQAEFAFQAGYPDPDSWDTGAVEPDVLVDITRELTDAEMGSAFARWRRQWFDRIKLHEHQEWDRDNLSVAALRKNGRSWFEAFLHNYLGNRHIARAVIRYGSSTPAFLTSLHKAIMLEKKREQVAQESRAYRHKWSACVEAQDVRLHGTQGAACWTATQEEGRLWDEKET